MTRVQRPGLDERFREAFAQDGSDDPRGPFAAVWQDRVKPIRIGHADDPKLIAAAV